MRGQTLAASVFVNRKSKAPARCSLAQTTSIHEYFVLGTKYGYEVLLRTARQLCSKSRIDSMAVQSRPVPKYLGSLRGSSFAQFGRSSGPVKEILDR